MEKLDTRLIKNFEERNLSKHSLGWISDYRLTAINLVKEMGMPKLSDEDWRFTSLKDFSLKQLSAIKSLLSLFITLVSVSIFFLNNFIAWSFVFYMMFFSIFGGFIGAKLTEVLPNQLLRRFIILVGISLSISLFTLNYL